MCGWLSAAIARASCSKRSRCSGFRRLMATVRSSRVSRAFHTSTIPPAPIGSSSVYGPRLVCGVQRSMGGDADDSMPRGSQVRRDTFENDVVRAFRLAGQGGSEGPHYVASAIEEGGGRPLVHDGQRTDVG